MSNFQKAGILQLNIDTQLPVSFTLSSADVKKILYQKPDGTSGEWDDVTVSGTIITKNLSNTDIDQKGNWTFQSYVEFSGEKGYGDKIEVYFNRAIGQS